VNGRIGIEGHAESIRAAHNDLFASGTLGRYSKILNSVLEKSLVEGADNKNAVEPETIQR
jgi:hypothetical protein